MVLIWPRLRSTIIELATPHPLLLIDLSRVFKFFGNAVSEAFVRCSRALKRLWLLIGLPVVGWAVELLLRESVYAHIQVWQVNRSRDQV